MSWAGGVPFPEVGMTQQKMVLLEELAGENEYWKTVSSFVQNISGRMLSSLSDGQRGWLEDICATLEVELSKRTAKEVFNP